MEQQIQEIGRFYAISFDNQIYEFIVRNDDCIYLNNVENRPAEDNPQLDRIINNPFNRLIIKPRFVLSGENGQYYILNVVSNEGLIKNFAIDDDLFDYLKGKDMIRYSVDMSYLYGFKDHDGYDKEYGVKSPFKWAKKKNKVLLKQKEGNFNW